MEAMCEVYAEAIERTQGVCALSRRHAGCEVTPTGA